MMLPERICQLHIFQYHVWVITEGIVMKTIIVQVDPGGKQYLKNKTERLRC